MTTRSGNILVIRSTEPEYPQVLGMVANGVVHVLGERYDANGTRVLAVSAGAKPNAERGFIRIGEEYFTLALKDYDDWQEKWWREAIQNAVDAGARNVTCTVALRDDGNYDVSCEDDAGGMDLDTVINKFLVLGGTTKKIGSTTGGFGKAKELLILPWISWRMETRDVLVEGAGGGYETGQVPARRGTKISVVMPADNATSGAAAAAFIGKCFLPHVHFVVNGEPVKANLKVGESLRNFDGKAELSQNKRGTFDQLMVIRANGLFMFGRSIPREVPGTLVVELLRPSIDLLTANRDGFRDSSLGWTINQFANELAADVKSALSKKKGIIREKFQGTGKFRGASASQVESAMAMDLAGKLSDATGGKSVTIKTGDIADLVRILDELLGDLSQVPEASSAGVNMRTDGQLAEAMLGGLDVKGQTHVENIAKQLAWEPDFFVVNDIEGFHVPSKFKPAGMTPTIAKLARYWAELCKFVLIQVGSSASYGVGWIFKDETAAAYLAEQGEHWLLLNPFKSAKPDGEMYSLSKDYDLNELYASAVHEVTHLADGVSYHNESFASAMTKNVARCAGKDSQIRKIRKAVVARKPSGERKAGRTRTAPSSKDGLSTEETAVVALMVSIGAVDSKDKAATERDLMEYLQADHSPNWTMQSVRDTLLGLEKLSPTLAVETVRGSWIVTDAAEALVKPEGPPKSLFWDQALVLRAMSGQGPQQNSQIQGDINYYVKSVPREWTDMDRTRAILESLERSGMVKMGEFGWEITRRGEAQLKDLQRYLPADHGSGLNEIEKQIMASFTDFKWHFLEDVQDRAAGRGFMRSEIVDGLILLRSRGWVQEGEDGKWKAHSKGAVNAFAAYMVEKSS